MKYQFLFVGFVALTFSACLKKENTAATTDLTTKTNTVKGGTKTRSSGDYAISYEGTGVHLLYTSGAANDFKEFPSAGNSWIGIVGVQTTGIAVKGQMGYTLCEPSAGADWEIIEFPLGNPAAASTYIIIVGSNGQQLEDIEYDQFNNEFVYLDRTNPSAVNINKVSAATPSSLPASLSYTIISSYNGTNVRGLGARFSGPSGATGSGTHYYLLDYNSPSFDIIEIDPVLSTTNPTYAQINAINPPSSSTDYSICVGNNITIYDGTDQLWDWAQYYAYWQPSVGFNGFIDMSAP